MHAVDQGNVTMKLVSFNINGIRARLHQLQAILDKHQPALVGLQETKVRDSEFPEQPVVDMGYQAIWHGQKGHYGVAMLSPQPLHDIQRGFPNDADDAQRRMIMARLPGPDNKPITVLNGYFPQGESRSHPVKFPAKRQFYSDLLLYLERNHQPDEHLVIMGDFNISPEDIDIGIGEENRKRWLRTGKCSFLPEEREWFGRLLDWGLTDAVRSTFPEETDLYSWFDYRSRGFEKEPKHGLRIDTLLTTVPLMSLVTDAGIDYDIRAMERPSDHCPVWIKLEER